MGDALQLAGVDRAQARLFDHGHVGGCRDGGGGLARALERRRHQPVDVQAAETLAEAPRLVPAQFGQRIVDLHPVNGNVRFTVANEVQVHMRLSPSVY
jgi:hypothetical protein